MRVLFAGHKERGVACLRAILAAGHHVTCVIGPHTPGDTPGAVAQVAREAGAPWCQPLDVNADDEFLRTLRSQAPDVTVLAGYGPIVRQPFLDVAPFGCLNLHAGRLPQYRGSSPLNWALIRGEAEFSLSIIRADRGVDTGDVLVERTFPIGPNDTIADLHATANREFPRMLIDLLARLQRGPVDGRRQDEAQAGYYPLRFPDDGLIVWDLMTAQEVHNRIRALTDPYPGAFTLLGEQRVRLLESRPTRRTYYGEPGRVYLKNQNGLLVCAADRCLWIVRAVMVADASDAVSRVARYDRFATARTALLASATATWS